MSTGHYVRHFSVTGREETGVEVGRTNELKRIGFFFKRWGGGNPVIYMPIKMIQEGMKNC